MPQDRELQAAREAWESFVTRDPATPEFPGVRGWDAEVVYVEDPQWPGADSFRGLEVVQRRFAEYLEVLGEDVSARLEDVVAGADGMVAVVAIEGRSAGGGVPYGHRWGYHFRTSDGRITWFRAYLRPEEAFAVAGVAV